MTDKEAFDAIMTAEFGQTETFDQQIAQDYPKGTLWVTLRARGVRRIWADAVAGYQMVKASHK